MERGGGLAKAPEMRPFSPAQPVALRSCHADLPGCESHMLPLIFKLGIRHKTLLISMEFPTLAIQEKCVPLTSHS